MLEEPNGRGPLGWYRSTILSPPVTPVDGLSMSCGPGPVSHLAHLPGDPPSVMALLAHRVPSQVLIDLVTSHGAGKHNGPCTPMWFSGQGPVDLSGTGVGSDP